VKKIGFSRNVVVCAAVMLLLTGGILKADALPSYNNIYVGVANSAGAKYDDQGDDTYWVGFSGGGGLNAVHITSDYASPSGSVVETAMTSGTFYVTDTGSRGYSENAVLMVAIQASSLPAGFNLHLTASGYDMTTNAAQSVTSYSYVANAMDEDFDVADFTADSYGPHAWKPNLTANYPIFFGEDVFDPASQCMLLFVDLYAGPLAESKVGAQLTYDGQVRVDYQITNLPGPVHFNAYTYTVNSNSGVGIFWTNRTSGLGSSGWTVTPEPSSLCLVLLAGGAMAIFRKGRKTIRRK